MERYHTKHHDPEAVGHSPEATQVFVPLHRLETATIQRREELHPAAVCPKALDTVEIQSLDAVQPEHDPFHKQYGE